MLRAASPTLEELISETSRPISEISEGGRRSSGTSARRRSSRRDVEEASHMLLYLNEATFVGKEGEVLAEEVRSAPVPTASLW